VVKEGRGSPRARPGRAGRGRQQASYRAWGGLRGGGGGQQGSDQTVKGVADVGRGGVERARRRQKKLAQRTGGEIGSRVRPNHTPVGRVEEHAHTTACLVTPRPRQKRAYPCLWVTVGIAGVPEADRRFSIGRAACISGRGAVSRRVAISDCLQVFVVHGKSRKHPSMRA